MLLMLMTTPVMAATITPITFSDIQAHWAKDTITWGMGLGIALGFPDDTFRPDNTVTESQFLAMLERTFTTTRDGNPWYQPYYDLAKTNNYPVGTSPDALILRSQVAEIVSGTQGVNYTGNNAIQYLLGKGLAKGYTDTITVDNYHGADTLTRAQAVQFIKNLKDNGIQEIKARPFEPSPVSELPPLPGQPTGITDVNQLTPELIQTIKDKQAPADKYYWTSIEDKYFQQYLNAIQKDLKNITYDGAETVVISKTLFYKNDGGTKYFRVIVNGNQLWDVGVGYQGAGIYTATPGWKVSSTVEGVN